MNGLKFLKLLTTLSFVLRNCNYFVISYLLDLLSHQMHQQLKLSEHLKYEKKELQHMTCEVRDLEMKLDRRQLQLRSKLSAQSKSQLESRVKDLETSCQSLIEEVTELTDGKVPLGETSLEFYESLPLILSVDDHLPTPTFPQSIVKGGGNEHSQPHGDTSPVKIQD